MFFRPVTGRAASGASEESNKSLLTVFLVETSMKELGAENENIKNITSDYNN